LDDLLKIGKAESAVNYFSIYYKARSAFDMQKPRSFNVFHYCDTRPFRSNTRLELRQTESQIRSDLFEHWWRQVAGGEESIVKLPEPALLGGAVSRARRRQRIAMTFQRQVLE